jgi:hypothetical protein
MEKTIKPPELTDLIDDRPGLRTVIASLMEANKVALEKAKEGPTERKLVLEARREELQALFRMTHATRDILKTVFHRVRDIMIENEKDENGF